MGTKATTIRIRRTAVIKSPMIYTAKGRKVENAWFISLYLLDIPNRKSCSLLVVFRVIHVTVPLAAVLHKSAAALWKRVLPMVRDMLDRAKTLLFLLRPFLERDLRIQNSR